MATTAGAVPSRAWSTRRPSDNTSGEPHRLQLVEFFSSDHFQQVGQQTATGEVAATAHSLARIPRKSRAVLGRCHHRHAFALRHSWRRYVREQRQDPRASVGSATQHGRLCSANADRPPHRCKFDGRGLRQCYYCTGGRCRSYFVSATTVGEDERCVAALAVHHHPRFRPFPASRAAELYIHRSFSTGRRCESSAVRGRCRDRDRFSADRDMRVGIAEPRARAQRGAFDPDVP